MAFNPGPIKLLARIQRKPEGRCRRCAVGISAELVENLENGAKTRKFNLTAAIEIEEVHHRKLWQQKLLARFWGMLRAAIALFL